MSPDVTEFARRFAVLGTYLHQPEVAHLVAALEPTQIAQGAVLLREGEASDSLYLVWEGALAVSLAVDGERLELGQYGPGSVVGEIAFLDGGPVSATVAAAAPARLYQLRRARFEALRETDPRAATGVMRALCRTLSTRMRSATEALEALRGHGAPARHHRRLRAALALFGLAGE